MKLSELNPAFLSSGGAGIFDSNMRPVPKRDGVGLAFDCPCGCGARVYVDFENPIDGGEPVQIKHPKWKRTGETFDTITLAPSVQRVGGCGWHGYIENGSLRDA